MPFSTSERNGTAGWAKPSAFRLGLLAICLGPSDPAVSVQPKGDFSCEPGSINVKRHEGSLVVQGRLKVPTPGYSYSLQVRGSRDKTQHFRLLLDGSEASPLQVISEVDIAETFDLPRGIEEIRIPIEKDFHWGPNQIICERGKTAGE